MNDHDRTRAPHADLDVTARRGKAKKIIHLLGDHIDLAGAEVLEVGTGSGVIAAMIAERVGSGGTVWAVDLVDQRVDPGSVHFKPVSDTSLPFADASFDLVVSNHVIEHVGGAAAQRHHVREAARVLRPGGSLYIATPNRWAPVEPHFDLPLLSWLPERHRSAYVRALRRGSHYDCRPLTRAELIALLEAHRLECTELSRAAIDAMCAVEDPPTATRALLRLSAAVFPLARPVVPTLIFLARRRG